MLTTDRNLSLSLSLSGKSLCVCVGGGRGGIINARNSIPYAIRLSKYNDGTVEVARC